MKDAIIKALNSVEASCVKNEIAYLALTSKIEHPFRDRLAYALHLQLGEQYIVSREWKRADLAILQDRIPIALIELKAMYTFDAIIDFDHYSCQIEADFTKMNGLAASAQHYCILLATHPKKRIEPYLFGVAKYNAGINRSIKIESEEQIKQKANQNVFNKFGENTIIARGSITGGSSFGIETDVVYWLIGEDNSIR